MADEQDDLVENYLGLGPFFKRHQDHILDKLEECDQVAEQAGRNKDMIFFAESLPIIDGLIHVGTTRAEYTDALKRVKEDPEYNEYTSVEPAHVISALTFFYVANRGKEIAHSDKKGNKRRDPVVWDRIASRVEKLKT